MKILLVSSTFPPRKFGGITASSYSLARNLVDRGHEVVVYTTDIDDAHSRLPDVRGVNRIDGMAVRYFRNTSNWLAAKRLYSPIGLLTPMRKELCTFDIIHLNEFRSFQSILVHHYAQKYGIPYVVQAHGSAPGVMGKRTLGQIYDVFWGCRLLRDASKAIALTETEARQYVSMGVGEDKIEIVPNGINLSEFENLPQRGEFRRKYGLSDKQKIILFLARIHRIKGPDLLAKAFAGLSKDLNNTKFVIAGPDDGYLPTLKKLIKELGIGEEVLFTGPLYGDAKLEAYVDADVYVLPSAYEAFPVTALEACACGTPVVVTDRCGIADVIDGQAGLVVPCDKDRLGNAISRMLRDDQMRRDFGDRGKLLVRQRFDWAEIAEQVERIYLSCISTRY